jgi:hypothetical protein
MMTTHSFCVVRTKLKPEKKNQFEPTQQQKIVIFFLFSIGLLFTTRGTREKSFYFRENGKKNPQKIAPLYVNTQQ